MPAEPLAGLPTPYAEAVLDLVARIPPGRVMTYGDVAAALPALGIVGGGPRQVGSALAQWGGGVPWHRVIRSDGRPASGHEIEALARLRAEATPLRAAGDRVDLPHARWTP